MDIWSNPLKPDCMKCTQWELMSRHVQSEWLLFPPLLALSCRARLDVSENGTLDQFGVRERASASAFYGRRSAAKSARFQRPSCKTPKISFGNGTENMFILIKSSAIITRPMYCTFAVQCSSFIKWFLTNHKWRHVRRDLVFSSQIKN